MDYSGKRRKVKLSAYTVAKELGVDFNKYKLVENGIVHLEKDLLDKFLEITQPENAKMIKFNRDQRLFDIKNFASHNENLKKLMKDRKYNQNQLADVMGVKKVTMSKLINYGKNKKDKVSDDLLERVYDFLMNPLNINPEYVVVMKDDNKPEPKEEQATTIKCDDNYCTFGNATISVSTDINTIEIDSDGLRVESNDIEELREHNKNLINDLIDMEEKIHELEEQIRRYEILIDMIGAMR